MTEPELMTYEEAAKFLDPSGALGITKRTIRRLVEEGMLTKIKIGRAPAVTRRAIMELQLERTWSTGDPRDLIDKNSRSSKGKMAKKRRSRPLKEVEGMSKISREIAALDIERQRSEKG
ncbi:helix-turn-helix domain-containing protein [Pelagibius sp. Alg239-R121]|uniref:helix-turn-helix domain-containing protein n=1 Tax=Pelagibius sp. Alg239-R121 TaxID=2993448 RepID=UPI0024A70935|nr:helix-turn-helix domain-containing protein [Pelagibius sp. Alg239-R121]